MPVKKKPSTVRTRRTTRPKARKRSLTHRIKEHSARLADAVHAAHVRRVQHTVLYAVVITVHLMWSLFGYTMFVNIPATRKLVERVADMGLVAVPRSAQAATLTYVGTAEGDGQDNRAGWTEAIDARGDDSRDANLSVTYKLMGATPDSIVYVDAAPVTTSGSVTVVHVWRNVDQATPMDVAAVSATGINTPTCDSPSITPSTSGAQVLSICLSTNGGGSGDTSFTAPTGYTNQADHYGNGSGMSAQAGIASKSWSSGAENPDAWTGISGGTADSWAAATLALRPASGQTLSYVGATEQSGTAPYSVDLSGLSLQQGDLVILATGFAYTADLDPGVFSYTIDLSGLSMQQGDLAIVACGWTSITNGDPGIVTSGYTEVADVFGDDTRDANLSVNWKLMGATPDTSVECLGANTTYGSVGVVHVWRGADQTTPMDAAATSASAANSALCNSPSITPVTTGAYVLSICLSTAGASAGDTSITAPTGYGNQADHNGNALVSSSQSGIASKSWTSGAEDPAAWTNITTSVSDSYAAVTVAIRPDVDSTAPTVTSIASDKAAGSYKAGEVIDIDVTFSEAVTSTGNVTVTLETGDTDRTCTFTVSNATTGTCNYTVQAGDTSADLDATISGTIKDQANNSMSNYTPATGLAANEALVIDTTAPTISATAPATSASINNITSASDVSYTLSEAVASGTIVMTRTGGTADGSSPRTCTLTGTALSTGAHSAFDMSNTTNGCTVAQSLVDGAVYSFAFNATDAAGNAATTVTNTSITYDATNPTMSTLSPADNATGVSATADLVMNLSESVTVNTGNVVIKKTSDNSTVETISISSGQVTGSGTASITVNPSVTLAGSTSYYVQVASTALQDAAGNAYAGISDTTTWNFTTANSPPTGMINSAYQKTDGTGLVDIFIAVADSEGDLSKAKIEYQSGATCAGGSWTAATLVGPASAQYNDTGGAPSITADTYQVGTTATTQIKTASGSNVVEFDWDSATDLPTGNATYCLRLTVNDGTSDQVTPYTQILTIDNVDPVAPGNLTNGGATGSTITLNYGTQMSDTNIPGTNVYKVFYKQAASGVTENDTEKDSTDFNSQNYGGNSSIAVTGLSPDTQYVFNIWAYDSYGNKSNATEIAISTSAGFEYKGTGSVRSNSVDVGAISTVRNRNVLRVNWSQNVPTGCTLEVYLRGTNTGPTPNYSTSTWAGPYTGSGSTVSQNTTGVAVLQDKRFVQYRVDYASCNTNTESPTLYDIFLEFD